MDPLIPKSIQAEADAAGLSWNDYLRTLSPTVKADYEDQIRVYTKYRTQQIDTKNRREAARKRADSPSAVFQMSAEEIAAARSAADSSGILSPPAAVQPPTMGALEAGSSQSPVLSTEAAPAAQVDPLLAVPSFQQMARNTGQTPEQYLASLDEGDLNVHRQILLGAERKPASVAPVLESGPASPVVKTQTPILTPVAEPYVEPVVVPAPAATVPGEGVLAPKVVDPNQPTSYADMTPDQFLAQAQNSGNGTSPAGSEFPGLGADYSGILNFDSMMEKRTQGARQGVDAGVLENQAASGDQRAIAEINRRSNVAATVQTPNPADDPYTASPVLEGYHQMPDGSMMPNSEMSNSTGLTPNPHRPNKASTYNSSPS